MDCVNRDMRAIETAKYEVRDKTGWRRIASATATPQRSGDSHAEEEEEKDKPITKVALL